MRNPGLLPSLAVGLLLFSTGSAQEKGNVKTPEKLDGKWYVARQEQFGGAVPAVVARRLSLVIDGDKMEWYIGNPAPNMAATIAVDPEKKTIDARVTRGSLNGKTMLGIYKFEDGLLHVCWAEIDAKRPEKFASTRPGGGAFEYTTYSREPIKDGPPDPTREGPSDKKEPAVGKRPKFPDLKFTVPRKWEAKYQDGTTSWAIIYDGFTPSIAAQRALPRDYPKDLDDYIDRLQKTGDHFAYGLYWSEVTDKGKLPDGLWVVGKVNLKGNKEAKGIGFSIIRDLGGEKVIFESFSTSYEDAKLLKEAMDICKTATY